MPTNLPSTDWARSGRRLIAVFAVLATAVVGLIAIYAPQLRAAAGAHEARIVEEEDKAFCSTFGLGPASSRYADCCAALREIRTRYLERRVNDSIL
jgi:hypothetical protein